MINHQLVDHLFRHQHGKMVAILTRIFGLSNLQTIEDAVQDSFVTALRKWRTQIPENPEAWLIKASKNKTIDLLRKIKADHDRFAKIDSGPAAMILDDLFLDHEIEDSQLRMIFTACHPLLNPVDQIAFALKTISGFSNREIASALLIKEQSVKKRLTRARQTIKENEINFTLPEGKHLNSRLQRVFDVIYVIFNEGFHSARNEILVRKDLCGEAIRLIQMILKKESYRNADAYGLFGLMCLHAARLESKISANHQIVNLKKQDRTLWHQPLIDLGTSAVSKALMYEKESSYLFEAMVALEHVKAKSFEETQWDMILFWYQKLQELHPTDQGLLNQAVVYLQLQKLAAADSILKQIDPKKLEQRAYLFYATKADYYQMTGESDKAKGAINQAIAMVNNEAEKSFLIEKKKFL